MTRHLLRVVGVLAMATTFFIVPVPGIAQTAPPPTEKSPSPEPEPEYNFVIAALDSTGPRLIELERQTPDVATKVRGLGFGGAQSGYVVPSEKSTVRFPANRQLEFVIRVESRATDPQQQIQFIHWQPKEGNRYLIMAKASAFRGGRSTVDESAIKFSAEKYGQSSFRFWPIKPLPPGEYAVSSPKTADAFCFGIDPVQP